MTHRLSLAFGLAGVVSTLMFAVRRAPSNEPVPRPAALRRPVAAVLLGDGQTLAVANSQTGTISQVDLSNGRILDEARIGRSLSDLVAVPGSSLLFAVDQASAEAVLLQPADGKLTIVSRKPVCSHPVTARPSHDGRWVSVAGLWSHQLDILAIPADIAAAPAMRIVRRILLPFPPRLQHWLPDGNRLVVADSFGGRIAVVDMLKAAVIAQHELDAHNIRGMLLEEDGKHVILSHQTLDQDALINWQTVHSGRLMANMVCRIPVDALCDPKAKLETQCERIRAGDTGHGGGDPSALARLSDDRLAICLSGVSEVIVLNRHEVITGRLSVERRPTAFVRLPNGRLLTVNTFGDSVSMLDPNAGIVTRHIPLGPSRPLTAAERGELAFYDSRISHDGWMSCHSCHTDGHTNGLRSDTQGDGTDGAPKRVLSLRGTGNTNRWAWNGSMDELYEQVRNSMLTSMLSDDIDKGTAADLVEYLESLPPVPPRQPLVGDADDREQLARGRQIFLNHSCQNCHVPPLTYSSTETYDVGLEDENGQRKFNPPSLRGVGHATNFFHDNRAKSLESVFRDYAHPGEMTLTERELADLVRFLRSL